MAGSTPASRLAELKTKPPAAPVTPGQEAWRRFRKHRLALICLGVLSIIVGAVILGPWLWRVPINEIDFSASLSPPSLKHPLGTDDLGQDLLARILYGGRISLAVGLVAMLIAMTFGVLVGALAGMSRGLLDTCLKNAAYIVK